MKKYVIEIEPGKYMIKDPDWSVRYDSINKGFTWTDDITKARIIDDVPYGIKHAKKWGFDETNSETDLDFWTNYYNFKLVEVE